MNRTPDVEHVLRDYFTGTDETAPDCVLDLVEQRIGRQSQRRPWPFPGRTTTMTPNKLIAVLAAAFIVAVVGYAVLPGVVEPGSTVAPTSAPATASPAPSIVPPSAAASSRFSCIDGSNCLGILAPGTYDTSELIVPLRYSVPDGWQNPFAVEKGFMIQPTGNWRNEGLFVFIDPLAASQSVCSSVKEPGVGRTADALVDWLVSHPGLIVTGPTPESVGGLDGQALDYRLAAVVPRPCVSSANLFVHEPSDGLHWSIDSSLRDHVVLLDAGSHTVLVLVEARTERFEALVEAATPIIESFAFTPVP